MRYQSSQKNPSIIGLYRVVGLLWFVTCPTSGIAMTLDELKANAAVSQDEILSGIVRYERREWTQRPFWDPSVINEFSLESDRIDEATLPEPTLQDENILTFRRDGDQVEWKLYRKNTRDLDKVNPELVESHNLDYTCYTSVCDEVVTQRQKRPGGEVWDVFLKKRKQNVFPAAYGDHESIWEYGIADLLHATEVPEVMEKDLDLREGPNGMIEVSRRYSPEHKIDGSPIGGFHYQLLFDPANKGRFNRAVTFAGPTVPALGKTTQPVSSEWYFGRFQDFDGIRLPTRKVAKIYKGDLSPEGEPLFVLGIITEIVLTDVQLNVPVSDADLVVGMEEGDHVYDFLEEGTVKEFIVGQEEDE